MALVDGTPSSSPLPSYIYGLTSCVTRVSAFFLFRFFCFVVVVRVWLSMMVVTLLDCPTLPFFFFVRFGDSLIVL